VPELPESLTALTDTWASWITLDRVVVVLLVIAGWVVARALGRAAGRLAAPRTTAQHAMIAQRAVYYGALMVVAASALTVLGVDLSVLLGAAGVLTVAVGFAAQTSASNLISGLFLLGERPFVVGDIVTIGAHTGEVVSIDLMSVKLRTFDNLLLRIPNETLLRSDIKNLTHFPVRRYDLQLTLAFEEDTARVRDLLFDLADAHPHCLDEPRPTMLFIGFSDRGVQLQFSAWAAREHYLEVRNTLSEQVLETFRAEHIPIPLPQRVLHHATPAPEAS